MIIMSLEVDEPQQMGAIIQIFMRYMVKKKLRPTYDLKLLFSKTYCTFLGFIEIEATDLSQCSCHQY